MNLDHVIQQARAYLSTAVQATTDACRETGRFVYRHRESVTGAILGFAAGRALEQVPIVGCLLKPLASITLGAGGLILGADRELARRRVEAMERP